MSALLSVQAFLVDPNTVDAVDNDAVNIFRTNRSRFDEIALESSATHGLPSRDVREMVALGVLLRKSCLTVREARRQGIDLLSALEIMTDFTSRRILEPVGRSASTDVAFKLRVEEIQSPSQRSTRRRNARRPAIRIRTGA
jgi:hypothetical protein